MNILLFSFSDQGQLLDIEGNRVKYDFHQSNDDNKLRFDTIANVGTLYIDSSPINPAKVLTILKRIYI